MLWGYCAFFLKVVKQQQPITKKSTNIVVIIKRKSKEMALFLLFSKNLLYLKGNYLFLSLSPMKHSPEYEKFNADAKDFAKAGWQLSKSGSKLAQLLTKEYSDLAYQKSKEKRKSLSNSTRRNIKIALLAAPLLAGDAAPNAYFSKNTEKSDPKIEQIDNKEMLAELAEYKKLESKKFGTKLLQKKPERVKMLQHRNSDHKLRLMSFPEDSSEV